MLRQLTSDFVRGMPTGCLSMFEKSAREVNFSPGACIFAEGSKHPEFHVLLEGHVRLEMNIPSRARMPILTLGPGDILAWSAALSDGTMTATAMALDQVRTLSIPGDKLRHLCAAEDDFGYHFMKQLAVALSRRLLATRLQLLDLFADHESNIESRAGTGSPLDPEC